MNSHGTLALYDTLFKLLKASNWRDVRHCKTLVWMIIGLICSARISLDAWADYQHSRAVRAASRVRRFARFLNNHRIDVNDVYAPIIQGALATWGEHTLYLALDTSRLPGGHCLVRISVLYRGRAVPLTWQVLAHNSSSVAFDVIQPLLGQAAKLVPGGVKITLLADRGFCDTRLMTYLTSLAWHYRIRIKTSLLVTLEDGTVMKLSRIPLAPGEARFYSFVLLTAKRHGPVHLALGRPIGSQQSWLVVSDEPTNNVTFAEYGLRFRIEEEFLDEKSNGFQLEDTRLTGAHSLTRLCLVLAVATLVLVVQGSEVVASGRRREIDPHWRRGCSYLKLGWRWLRRCISGVPGIRLLGSLMLCGQADPEPAIASKAQQAKRDREHFDLLVFSSPGNPQSFPVTLALAA